MWSSKPNMAAIFKEGKAEPGCTTHKENVSADNTAEIHVQNGPSCTNTEPMLAQVWLQRTQTQLHHIPTQTWVKQNSSSLELGLTIKKESCCYVLPPRQRKIKKTTYQFTNLFMYCYTVESVDAYITVTFHCGICSSLFIYLWPAHHCLQQV